MARLYGLEVIRMASADVLPYDYEAYGKEITAYIEAARKRAQAEFGRQTPDFGEAVEAARKFQQAGAKMLDRQKDPRANLDQLNRMLQDAERALLLPKGLPNRPWYRHAIYAPGQYTGYAAVVIPGISEAIDAHDLERAKQQIVALSEALRSAARMLE
jgi:N-acetylated-alpha-linked acidic dipeptidase